MATEPRLATRLEDPLTLMRGIHPSGSLQLPPLQDPRPTDPASRPLPLEPSTSAHRDAPADATSTLSSRATEKTRKSNAAKVLSKDLVSTKLDGATGKPDASAESVSKSRASKDRPLPQQAPESPRKRRRIENVKAPGEFVQLPNPAQKPPQFTKPAPATLSALQDPPPNAALFPPISTEAFPEEQAAAKKVPESQPKNNKSASTIKAAKKQLTRPRKKWTEEETDDLLRGVALFGIGCWKKILSHSEFTFNNRSSIDLKDRFRTCCPDAYRKHMNNTPSDGQSPSAGRIAGDIGGTSVKPLASILTENILIASEPTSNPSPSSSKPRKSRSHRKNPEDLARLGIEGPFRKAARRERRAFRQEEDEDLLKGYNKYGPMWSRIRNDPSFNLGERRATDLRDRFRNRYPEKYAEAGFKSRPRATSKATPVNQNKAPPLSTEAEAIAKKKMLEREQEREERKTSREQSEDDREEDSSAENYRPGIGNSEDSTDDADDPELMVSGSMFDDWNENTLAPFQSSSESDLHRFFDNINPIPSITRHPPLQSASHSVKLAPVLNIPKYSNALASPNTAGTTPTPSTGKSKGSLSSLLPTLSYPNSSAPSSSQDGISSSHERPQFTLPGPSELITPSALDFEPTLGTLNPSQQQLTNNTPSSSITGIHFKPADILKRARPHHSLAPTTSSSTNPSADTTSPAVPNTSSSTGRHGLAHMPSLATSMESISANVQNSNSNQHSSVNINNPLQMGGLNPSLGGGMNGFHNFHMPMPIQMHHSNLGGHNQASNNPTSNQAHSGGINPVSISNHMAPGLNLPLHNMPMNINMTMPMNLHVNSLNLGMPMGMTPMNSMMGSFGPMSVGMPVGVGLGIDGPSAALMWEDMANHPIFDIENAGAGTAPGPGPGPVNHHEHGPPIPNSSTTHAGSGSLSTNPAGSLPHFAANEELQQPTTASPAKAAAGAGAKGHTASRRSIGGPTRPSLIPSSGPPGSISFSSIAAGARK